MESSWVVLLMIHLVGLALGVGSATAKVVLLLKCYRDHTYVASYLKVVKPLTRILVLGLLLMTLSGIIWLILGYGFPTRMIIKLVLVAIVWILGIVIDNVTEPQFIRFAPSDGDDASPAFIRIERRHLVLESLAAFVFFIIMVMGVLL